MLWCFVTGGDQAQPLSSAGASASLSRLMNKLQKPRKSRVTGDATPVPVLPLDSADGASNGMRHSQTKQVCRSCHLLDVVACKM